MRELTAAARETSTALGDPKAVLRGLTANDEQCLGAVLAGTPNDFGPSPANALDRRIRALVRLGALLAVDAPTTSLQWAVELASTNGVDDESLVAVLATVAPATGAAQAAIAAPRLALALGLDIDQPSADAA